MSDDQKRLSLEDILTAEDISTVDVEIPEWGGTVKVKSFTKRQQVDIRNSAARNSDGTVNPDEFERVLVLTGLVDPSIDDAQYNLLMEKSARAMDALVEHILRVNGMTEEAEKESVAGFQERS